MKKMIAFAMSVLMTVSAVAIPVTAEPTVPFSDVEWVQNVRPVSAEELAQVRSIAFDHHTVVPEASATEENVGCITNCSLSETVLRQSKKNVQSQTSNSVPKPVVAHVTSTTIVLEQVEGYEYCVSGGMWITHNTSNVFTNLSPNTVYECYLTLPGDQSIKSEPTIITTKDRTPCSATPKAPLVAEYTDNTIVLVRREGYEYRMNNGNWEDSYIFSDLEPNTEYTFYQRIKQTRAELASESSEPLRCKTAPIGPSSSTNMDRLMEYIEANGYEDEDGNKTLAYMATDELGTEYYFVMINQGTQVLFDVFSYSEEADCLLFNTEFSLGHYDTCVFVDFTAMLYSNDTCVDYVNEFTYIYLNEYHIGDPLTIHSAGYYLASEDLSTLCTMTTQMSFAFWDEYIYDTLGFGFRGLGFVVTEGYGNFACHSPLEAHFGDTVIKDQREAECLLDGCEGVHYCTLCGQRITDYFGIPSRGYHVYDNNCDTDCNDCGEPRHVFHLYSLACDTECDICGALRTDPLAAHSVGENQVCTKCGQSVRQLGDVNGDGKVNMGDVAKAYAHVRGTGVLTDSAALAAADVSGDGKINLGDVSKIIAHASGTKPIG